MKFLCGIIHFCSAFYDLSDTYYKDPYMYKKNIKLRLSEFIKFYSNLNNPQLKNLGDCVWVVNNKLKLSVENNEIMISCDDDDINSALEELEQIYDSFNFSTN